MFTYLRHKLRRWILARINRDFADLMHQNHILILQNATLRQREIAYNRYANADTDLDPAAHDNAF